MNARMLVPLALGIAVLVAWEVAVRALQVPRFVLPAPSLIAASLLHNLPSLSASLLVTLRITLLAFAAALAGGVGLAVLFVRSRLLEAALFPYAVVLQVTPVVSIAPLIIIWVGLDHVDRAELIIATIVAFFPILSNTTLGLKSADHNLHLLFDLYHARDWQRLLWLRFPSALPYLLAGMKISGGLALIGAVVAEFIAGSGTATGLAWQIVEAGNRLDIPRLFAGLILLSVAGLAIFFALSALERALLRRWHDSVREREA